MPQPRKIDDQTLVRRLSATFKDVGYEGASLNGLAEATGLKKASLYHRYPRGKEQMAEEVLLDVAQTLDSSVLPVMAGPKAPEEKMAYFVQVMRGFYSDGKESCLLNMLCPPRGTANVCSTTIAGIFGKLRGALAGVAIQAGAAKAEADLRAERALVDVHGALVVSRGTGDSEVFARMLARLPAAILA